MKMQVCQLNIVNSILWAAAILAGAIFHAPFSFTLVLLLLFSCSLASIEVLGRRLRRS